MCSLLKAGEGGAGLGLDVVGVGNGIASHGCELDKVGLQFSELSIGLVCLERVNLLFSESD